MTKRNAISYRCPAKINWNLQITGRRSDGFHLIQSIFVPIFSLHDLMTIELLEDHASTLQIIRGGRYGKLLPDDPHDNLIGKVVDFFRNLTDFKHSLKIHLEKNIPVAAGLGGGSSNAGSIVNFLVNICPEDKQIDFILGLPKIGADITFFVEPDTALVTGIGELIAPIEFSLPANILIVTPNFEISASEAYKLYRDAKIQFDTQPRDDSYNCLEPMLLDKYVALDVLKKEIMAMQGIQSFTISGS
ncbi:MAG: 4-(cytidine 5'-diphospho)-2-C-methyl-D-erythritol kinase, partial [Lentisphaeria bacterium]